MGMEPPHHRMFEDHRRALRLGFLLVAATALVFAALAFGPARDAVDAMDEAVWRGVQRLQSGVLTVGAKALDYAGGVWITTPIRIGVSIWLIVRRRWAALSAWVLTWVLVEVMTTVAKSVYDRPRPPNSLVPTTGASFPSGHASATAATAVALVIVLLPPGSSRLKWEVRAVAIATLMAASRVYLNAHWFWDTVGGSLLGAWIAILSAGAVSELRLTWWRRRGDPRAEEYSVTEPPPIGVEIEDPPPASEVRREPG